MSIYEFTRKKLKSHGVDFSQDGRITLSDRHLFLIFVRLERARQLSDLCIIKECVETINDYCKHLGKPHLVIFAYMYLRFSSCTPKFTHLPQPLADGNIRYIKDYERDVSQSEIAIGEWATYMYNKYARHFLRILVNRED